MQLFREDRFLELLQGFEHMIANVERVAVLLSIHRLLICIDRKERRLEAAPKRVGVSF
jgi:hypothetical protein